MKTSFIQSVKVHTCLLIVLSSLFVHAEFVTKKTVIEGVTYTYAVVPVRDGKGVMLSANIPQGVTRIGDYMVSISPVPTELNVPDMIEGLPVKVIGAAAFVRAEQLKKVRIPDSVEWIEPGAFYSCTNLESVVMPRRAQRIGMLAFAECTQLRKIAVPEGVAEIKESTFDGCRQLQNVFLPESVTNIEDEAFRNCEHLHLDKLPKKLTTIGRNAFLSCKSLTQIEIPSTVRSVDVCTFANCNNILRVKLLCDLDSLSGTFENCTRLTTVEFVGKAGRLRETFTGCSNICTIVGLHNVDRIWEYAFEENVFKNIAVNQKGIRMIDDWLVGFGNCTNAVFDIPDGTKIVDGIFKSLPLNSTVNLGDCPHVENDYVTVEPEHQMGSFRKLKGFSGMFEGCTNLVRLSIARRIKEVPMALCKDCANLVEVRMWDGYEVMNGDAFTGCTNLLHFTLPKTPTFTLERWNKSVPKIVQERMYENDPYNSQLQCLYLADAEWSYNAGKFDLITASEFESRLESFIKKHPDPNAEGIARAIECLREAMFGLRSIEGKYMRGLTKNYVIDRGETLRRSFCRLIASTYDDAASLSILADKAAENGREIDAVDLNKRAARAFAKLVVKELKEKKKVNPFGIESNLRPRDFMTRCVEDIARMGYKATAEALLAELDAMIERGKKEIVVQNSPMSTGTGWAVNESHIATCWHVVKRALKISCELPDGTRLPLEVVAHDEASDVAVLKLRSSVRLQAALPLQAKTAKTAERVFTIGYPLSSLLGQSQKYTEGTISATTGIGNDGRMYQISVPIQLGGSRNEKRTDYLIHAAQGR